jgi:hypothetical protein
MRAIVTTLLLWVQDWFGRMLMPPPCRRLAAYMKRGLQMALTRSPQPTPRLGDGLLFCGSWCALLRIGNHSKRFSDQLSQYANGLLFVGFDLARSRVSLG